MHRQMSVSSKGTAVVYSLYFAENDVYRKTCSSMAYHIATLENWHSPLVLQYAPQWQNIEQ